MNWIKTRHLNLLWLVLLPFAGCGGGGGDTELAAAGNDDSLTGTSCVEGRTLVCACGDASKGARVCDDGIWTDCLCNPQPECGDGEATGDEMCDGDDLDGETCASATMGMMTEGEVSCSESCTIDTSDCSEPSGSGGTGGSGMVGEGGMSGSGGMTGGGGSPSLF